MPSAFVLAALIVTAPHWRVITLPESDVRIRLPVGVVVTHQDINWETEAVELRMPDSSLVEMIIGGGAYDLRGFRRFCLNGKRAWDSGPLRQRSRRQVIVGSPGANALSATYSNLSKADASLADRIISSIHFDAGEICHA